MRTFGFILGLAMLTSLAACDILEDGLQMGRPRRYCQRQNGDGYSKDNESPGHPLPDDSIQRFVPDTAIFLSAVRCDPSYDWRRDTAYGGGSAELLLIRDGEVAVTIPSGPDNRVSAAPDMHHIIDGHLYTEYSTGDRTFIGRDGHILFDVEGREFLKGILVRDSTVYTLSEFRSGKGFVLRKDGIPMLVKSEGRIIGDFSDPAYHGSGALYRDEGRICFSYLSANGGMIVRDGVERCVTASPEGVQDIRSVKGKDIIAGRKAFGYEWEGARIRPFGSSYCISGDVQVGDERFATLYNCSTGRLTRLGPEGSMVYSKDGMAAILTEDELDGFYFFTGACADMLGDALAVALTPVNRESPPILRADGSVTEFGDLNGFLTGVSVEISLPSLSLSPHHPIP